jgi:hypothetical protein
VAAGLVLLLTRACGDQARPPVDVCVFGGTPAGITAAIAARRLGQRVVLIEPGHWLGGMTAGGLGATDVGTQRAIGGLAREFYDRVRSFYVTTYGEYSQQATDCRGGFRFEPHVAERVLKDWLAELAIAAWTDEPLVSVAKDGERVTAAVFGSGLTVQAAEYIDASYEGDLLAAAGVSYTVGREANAVYQESLNGRQFASRNHNFKVEIDPWRTPGSAASGLLPGVAEVPAGSPGEGDASVQAYCYRMCLSRAPDRRPFPRPAGYDPERYALLARYLQAGVWDVLKLTSWLPNGKTDTNNNGAFSTDDIGAADHYPEAGPTERAAIIAEHQAYQQGLMWFLGHDERVPPAIREEVGRWGLPPDEFTDTGGWPHQLYIREARRMVGEYVMTEHDCRGETVAPDSVGLASYGMDSHNCRRIVVDGRVRNEGNVEQPVPAPYPISYRALLPRRGQVANLLAPVCLSASHIAYGSIRMEPVFFVLGQSAGTAAALAVDQRCDLHHLPYERLKACLERDGQVLAWQAPREDMVRAAYIDPASLAGIVLDDQQATLIGPWHRSTIAYNRMVGDGYVHDGDGNKGDARAIFEPELPAAGRYEIFLFAPPHENRASRVPVTVEVVGQSPRTVYVNQRNPAGHGHLSLGIYDLPAGRKVKVTVSNRETDGYVVVDGMQFLPVSEPAKAEPAPAPAPAAGRSAP